MWSWSGLHFLGGAAPGFEQLGDLCLAEEALAAAVLGAGASTQPFQGGGRDRCGEGVADLAGGDALAEADDLAVGGVSGDALCVAVGPQERLSDVGHVRRVGQVAALLERDRLDLAQ